MIQVGPSADCARIAHFRVARFPVSCGIIAKLRVRPRLAKLALGRLSMTSAEYGECAISKIDALAHLFTSASE
jgi:hypothetical protein